MPYSRAVWHTLSSRLCITSRSASVPRPFAPGRRRMRPPVWRRLDKAAHSRSPPHARNSAARDAGARPGRGSAPCRRPMSGRQAQRAGRRRPRRGPRCRHCRPHRRNPVPALVTIARPAAMASSRQTGKFSASETKAKIEDGIGRAHDASPERPQEAVQPDEAVGIKAGHVRAVCRDHEALPREQPQQPDHDPIGHDEMDVAHVVSAAQQRRQHMAGEKREIDHELPGGSRAHGPTNARNLDQPHAGSTVGRASRAPGHGDDIDPVALPGEGPRQPRDNP